MFSRDAHNKERLSPRPRFQTQHEGKRACFTNNNLPNRELHQVVRQRGHEFAQNELRQTTNSMKMKVSNGVTRDPMAKVGVRGLNLLDYYVSKKK